ncbi:LysR family transcriptional regulator [Kyrpidia spormannii]|uniref:HTH-type transcriptional regulator AlsR n=1 Tax=Kyrpidia spormannii TaxID=2055160 RepID=A0ACA8ZBZ0_9BACL|nr:LysR family transcriptional regulator [Kyrpidia spormannii]CAB3391452.1 HTH-type transcriptional regulator AlsR [Kyrpidia spormannii]
MEIRQLEYFVAVAEELHFGRAAERLHMTQPPLSQQIQRLENEIGVRLLSRTSRRVRLTPAGHAFLDAARKVLGELDEAILEARRAERGETGRLRVGFVGSATYGMLPLLVRTFREQYPGVKLYLQEMSTPQQEKALDREELDVGVVRPPLGDPSLYTAQIEEDSAMLAIPEEHALANRSSVHIDDLRGEPLVMLARKTWAGLFDSVVDLCLQRGFKPNIVQDATEFQTVIGLVAAGLGVAVVPGGAAAVPRRSVVFRPVTGPAPRFAMALAWRADDDSPLVHRFVTLAQRIKAQAPGV